MRRMDFLKSMALIPLVLKTMNLKELKNITDDFNSSDQWPVIFIGHGNPMNAILNNPFTQSLEILGKSFYEKPNAIMVVSAHWLTSGTYVTVSEKPRIIYDFGGFPEELYHVQYPAKGSPGFARETEQLAKSAKINDDNTWGLDHGAWTVLKHMFPEANIPVFQLSIDVHQPAEYHYQLAKELKLLRNKGILIIGSGNIVHNLYQVNFSENAKPFDWAIEFDEIVKTKLQKNEYQSLVHYENFGQMAKWAVPTNDHYLPMLYTLGLANANENMTFTFEGIQNASISMRCFKIG